MNQIELSGKINRLISLQKAQNELIAGRDRIRFCGQYIVFKNESYPKLHQIINDWYDDLQVQIDTLYAELIRDKKIEQWEKI